MLGGAKPVAAGAAQITACPALITGPGTYVLVNDLICNIEEGAVPVAISVRASDVRLVLGEHRLTTNQGRRATGVDVSNSENVKVTGGILTGFETGISTGFETGISLSRCTNCSVIDSRISVPPPCGLGCGLGSGSTGIFVVRSPNARIAGNTVTDDFIPGDRSRKPVRTPRSSTTR